MSTKMTPEMKAFLSDLAALVDKHKVEIELTTDRYERPYIEVTMLAIYTESGMIIRDYCDFEMSKCITLGSDIVNLIVEDSSS